MAYDPIKAQWRVVRYGTDTSGRPVYLTWYHARWLKGRAAALKKKHGILLRIAQGAFMTKVAGGGAAASEGFHDRAKCVDLSVRGLNETQKGYVVAELRWNGAAGWRRDETAAHGDMPEHIHYNLGVDHWGTAGAEQQWKNYLTGDAGLAGSGRDYEKRPSPLVTVPHTPPFAGNIPAGARGGRIKAIQRGLRQKGYRVAVDGVYGPVTQKAVRSWKWKHGIWPSNTITSRAYWGITPL